MVIMTMITCEVYYLFNSCSDIEFDLMSLHFEGKAKLYI